MEYLKEKPNKIIYRNGSSDFSAGVSSVVFGDGQVIDPILENNPWHVIKEICQSGEAANYWSLGDEKRVNMKIGNVDYIIPHAIVDMKEGRYDYGDESERKTNVVFQSSVVFATSAFNASDFASPNEDTAYNGWHYSNLRAAMQENGTIFAYYDEEFSSLLESVDTYQAYSGMTNELHTQSDLLFIPAAGEVKSSPSYAQTCESGISEYGFYALNSDASAGRIKKNLTGNAAGWWLRSPYASSQSDVTDANALGNIHYNVASNSVGVAPCFAW